MLRRQANRTYRQRRDESLKIEAPLLLPNDKSHSRGAAQQVHQYLPLYLVSHQETGMNHADLQNISEIIKILNCLFQGITPESEK
jgi:hypothetical protein